MASDIATLGIKITQDGVSEAKAGLDALTASGAQAEKEIQSLGTASDSTSSQLKNLSSSAKDADSSQQSLGTTAAGTGASMQASAVGTSAAGDAMGSMALAATALELAILAVVAATLAFVGLCAKGVKDQQDFKDATESMAAAMTRMAKDQSNIGENWNQALDYTKGIYDELTDAAARHRMESSKIVDVWVAMANQGILVKKNESDALATIISGYTEIGKGQVRVASVARDIQGLMDGHVRSTSELVRYLESAGLDWQKIGAEMKATQSLAPLASAFEAQRVADEQRENSLKVQGDLITNVAGEILRQSGMYDNLLEIVKGINNLLREHKDELIAGMISGWNAVAAACSIVWELVKGIYFWVKSIYDIVSTAITWAITIAVNVIGVPEWLAGWLSGKGRPGGTAGGIEEGFGATTNFGKDVERTPGGPQPPAASLVGGGEPGALGYGTAPSGPEKAPFDLRQGGDRPGGGKGGGGGKDTSQAFENMILQMREQIAKLKEGMFGDIDAQFNKTEEKLKQLAVDDKKFQEGMALNSELKAARIKKAEEDFTIWFEGQMHNTTAVQQAEDQKKLDSVKGHADLEEKVREAMALHEKERQEKTTLDIDNMYKSIFDSLAKSTPILEEKFVLEQKSLSLENEISRVTRERQLRDMEANHEISRAQADEFRGLTALEATAKKYALAMKQAAEAGGVQGWAIGRRDTAEARDRGAFGTMMEGAESKITQVWGQGMAAVFAGDKKQMAQAGKNIVEGMAQEMMKHSFQKIWDQIAKMLAPEKKSVMGGAGAAGGGVSAGGGVGGPSAGGVGGGSKDPGKELQVAAKELQTAGMGFNLNTAQFGLAAGGLLLSGIGIATNSKMLVYAGMVLQIAAMAIEIYQALATTFSIAGTTTEVTATGIAATALGVSATGLGSAAAALTAAAAALIGSSFYHAGGVVMHEGGLIRAHTGYLASDERMIIAQTGERVLSRNQNQAYETGMSGGGGTHLHINVDARGAQQGIDWRAITKQQIAPEIKKLIKNNRLTT